MDKQKVYTTEKNGIHTLCGVQGCCPTVDTTNPKKVVIKDDFGGKVELKPDEFRALQSI